MSDMQKCPLSRQEEALDQSIAKDRLICPRGNAHGFNAINESTKRNIFRVHIVEDAGG